MLIYPAVSFPMISQVDVFFKLFMVITILQDLVNFEEVGGGGGAVRNEGKYSLTLR